jgi:hypothetical protein
MAAHRSNALTTDTHNIPHWSWHRRLPMCLSISRENCLSAAPSSFPLSSPRHNYPHRIAPNKMIVLLVQMQSRAGQVVRTRSTCQQIFQGAYELDAAAFSNDS